MVPRLFKRGRPDSDVSCLAQSKTSGAFTVKDVGQVSPWFDVGLIQCFIERTGRTATPRVEWKSLTDYSIHFEGT